MTKASSAWKWWIVGVLFLATVLTYLDRQTVSVCGPQLCEEMGLSNEQFGQLLAAFRWAYAVTHGLAGFVADRFPLRGTYALAVLVWSAAGAGAAFVGSLGRLLWTRAVLGVGEAFNWPCATRMVANMFSPEDRGLASGIFNSGSAVGSFVAPFVIAPLAQAYGWRTAFFLIGSLGLCWVALWWVVTRRMPAVVHVDVIPAAPQVSRSDAEKTGVRDWMRQVLFHPAFWMLLLIGVSVNPCWYFLNEWIPKYMHDQHGMSLVGASLFTVPIFLGADLGNLLGGGLVKLLTLRRWSLRRARGTTAGFSILFVLPVTLVHQVESPYLVIAMLSLAACGMTSILANYTACQQDFSFANVGAVAGILGMACNVVAATVNPWIGRYVDRSGDYRLIFLLLAVLPVLALVAMWTFDALILGRREARDEG